MKRFFLPEYPNIGLGKCFACLNIFGGGTCLQQAWRVKECCTRNNIGETYPVNLRDSEKKKEFIVNLLKSHLKWWSHIHWFQWSSWATRNTVFWRSCQSNKIFWASILNINKLCALTIMTTAGKTRSLLPMEFVTRSCSWDSNQSNSLTRFDWPLFVS